MSVVSQIRNLVSRYVFRDLDLSAFAEQFAVLFCDIEDCGEPDAIRWSYSIESELAKHAEGFLSESALKQNLFASLFPSPSLSLIQQFSFGQFPTPSVVTGTLVPTVELPSLAFAGVGPATVRG